MRVFLSSVNSYLCFTGLFKSRVGIILQVVVDVCFTGLFKSRVGIILQVVFDVCSSYVTQGCLDLEFFLEQV